MGCYPPNGAALEADEHPVSQQLWMRGSTCVLTPPLELQAHGGNSGGAGGVPRQAEARVGRRQSSGLGATLLKRRTLSHTSQPLSRGSSRGSQHLPRAVFSWLEIWLLGVAFVSLGVLAVCTAPPLLRSSALLAGHHLLAAGSNMFPQAEALFYLAAWLGADRSPQLHLADALRAQVGDFRRHRVSLPDGRRRLYELRDDFNRETGGRNNTTGDLGHRGVRGAVGVRIQVR